MIIVMRKVGEEVRIRYSIAGLENHPTTVW